MKTTPILPSFLSYYYGQAVMKQTISLSDKILLPLSKQSNSLIQCPCHNGCDITFPHTGSPLSNQYLKMAVFWDVVPCSLVDID
jgi:hypothetical protein